VEDLDTLIRKKQTTIEVERVWLPSKFGLDFYFSVR